MTPELWILAGFGIICAAALAVALDPLVVRVIERWRRLRRR